MPPILAVPHGGGEAREDQHEKCSHWENYAQKTKNMAVRCDEGCRNSSTPGETCQHARLGQITADLLLSDSENRLAWNGRKAPWESGWGVSLVPGTMSAKDQHTDGETG